MLRRTYGAESDSKIGKRLDRQAADVAAKAVELALAKDRRLFRGTHMPRWTEEEIRFLRREYAATSNVGIARRLGRSAKSVASKGRSLGLEKSDERIVEAGREAVRLRRDREGA